MKMLLVIALLLLAAALWPKAARADAPGGFVLIKGGTFQMGSPEGEPWRGADEMRHEVTVSDFYLAPREVTQAEYEAVAGHNPSHFQGGDLPVESVHLAGGRGLLQRPQPKRRAHAGLQD